MTGGGGKSIFGVTVKRKRRGKGLGSGKMGEKHPASDWRRLGRVLTTQELVEFIK